MGRKRIHASDSEREMHYRKTKHRIDLLLPQGLGETLGTLSERHEISQNKLVSAMIRFALTNHDWSKDMLWKPTNDPKN